MGHEYCSRQVVGSCQQPLQAALIHDDIIPQKNQKKQKTKRPFSRSLAKGLRKTKKNKKTKDLSNYGQPMYVLSRGILVFWVYFLWMSLKNQNMRDNRPKDPRLSP